MNQSSPGAEPQKPNKDEPDSPAVNWSRIRKRSLWILALVSITFFFDGCESGDPEFTVGIVPFSRVSFGDLGWGQTPKLLDFWPIGLILNVALLAAMIVFVKFSSHRIAQWTRNRLQTRRVWIAVILTVGIFNSFLLIPGVWIWCVYRPTTFVLQGFSQDPPILIVRSIARILFAVWVMVLSLLMLGLTMVIQKYVLIDKERWWQVSVGGMFAIMVILGTLAGIIGRLIMQN